MFDLNKKNVVITGAGSGIGQSIAMVLASQGAYVFIFDANMQAAESTVNQIKLSGGQAEAYEIDVTDLTLIIDTIQSIEAHRPIDILINNAGIGHIGTAQSTTPQEYDKVQDINVKGYFHIRCNSISPGRVHTPFVDGYIAKTYPGKEKEIFEQLAKTQPIGRMGAPEEIAHLALYLCSDESAFVTGTDFPIDGGFITLNS